MKIVCICVLLTVRVIRVALWFTLTSLVHVEAEASIGILVAL